MTLYERLQKAVTEEDVKDAYIKALGLKDYTKGLVDIQTRKIWFEAKKGYKWSTYQMFTELCFYLKEAIKKGEALPAFLCVIDQQKAALLPTSAIAGALRQKEKSIQWGKSASDVTKQALEALSQTIGTHHTNYRIKTQETAFLRACQAAIKTGKIPRTPITPNNLKSVFDRWCQDVGGELANIKTLTVQGRQITQDTRPKSQDMCLLFYADVMSDDTGAAVCENLCAQLLHTQGKPCFILNGVVYNLQNSDGYRNFWATFDRPPAAEYRNYLLERRDCLLPTDIRAYRGEYYTPLKVVQKAYELLDALLGQDWQKDYIVWDPCCGVGNLETKHSNLHNVFMSTLKQEDLDIMIASKTATSAFRFQYDYLNDDIADLDFGEVFDYDMSNKMPLDLREVIKQNKECQQHQQKQEGGAKKILILMNPPYAEAGNGAGTKGGKGAVASASKVAKRIMAQDWGKATNELFTQFLARISLEMPGAVVAIFSTLKYINATNFQKFRQKWQAKYLGGFVFCSKVFEGLKGDFPIGFLVWQTGAGQIKDVTCSVLGRDMKEVGQKTFFSMDAALYLNEWIKRPKANTQTVVPLKNAFSVATAKFTASSSKWSDNAIGYIFAKSNDMQNSCQQTALFSSMYGDGHGIYITPDNLLQCAVVFAVRQIIKHTWLNHNDQFLQPCVVLPEEFYLDCLLWMLFHGKNLTASADGLKWQGKSYSIINHFIPYTEQEVGSTGQFASSFMSDFLKNKTLSPEAKNVLDAGRLLWRQFFLKVDSYITRQKYMLGRADVGFYQIRGALKARSSVDFSFFDATYKALTDKLQPKVFLYGFQATGTACF